MVEVESVDGGGVLCLWWRWGMLLVEVAGHVDGGGGKC